MMIKWNKKISEQTAFLIVLITGLVIAWATINVGDKIINSTQQKAFNKGEEIQKELNKV